MYIHVRVIAGAKKEVVEKIGESRYKISVKEKAERNEANERVLTLIAKECEVSRAEVRIVNGHHSPTKLISVR